MCIRVHTWAMNRSNSASERLTGRGPACRGADAPSAVASSSVATRTAILMLQPTLQDSPAHAPQTVRTCCNPGRHRCKCACEPRASGQAGQAATGFVTHDRVDIQTEPEDGGIDIHNEPDEMQIQHQEQYSGQVRVASRRSAAATRTLIGIIAVVLREAGARLQLLDGDDGQDALLAHAEQPRQPPRRPPASSRPSTTTPESRLIHVLPGIR